MMTLDMKIRVRVDDMRLQRPNGVQKDVKPRWTFCDDSELLEHDAVKTSGIDVTVGCIVCNE